MIQWPHLNDITAASGAGAGDAGQVLQLFAEVLRRLPDDVSYRGLLYGDKEFIQPLLNYAKGQYFQGVRADSVLSLIKSVLNAASELMDDTALRDMARLRSAVDIFEVQFTGAVLSEQAQSFNTRLDALSGHNARQESLFKSFIDSFHQVLFITDQLGNITDCNSAARKYFSIPLGHPYPKLLPLFDLGYMNAEDFLKTYMTRGRREVRLMSGTIFHIEVRCLENARNRVFSYLVLLEECQAGSRPKLVREGTVSFHKLTKTERLICELIHKGMRNKEIAVHMNVSEDTVKNHRKTIRGKLMLNNQKVNLYYFIRENYRPEE